MNEQLISRIQSMTMGQQYVLMNLCLEFTPSTEPLDDMSMPEMARHLVDRGYGNQLALAVEDVLRVWPSMEGFESWRKGLTIIDGQTGEVLKEGGK